MAMTAPVYPLLSTAPAVLALVPASRIHAQGHAGNTPTAPYITWTLVSGVPGNYVAGRPGFDTYRVQVDCWAADAAQAQAVAAAVRDTLELHAQGAGAFEERDAETGLYRYALDFRFVTGR